jgi:hypothetical protein
MMTDSTPSSRSARRFTGGVLGAVALLILGLAVPLKAPAVSVSPPPDGACPGSGAGGGAILSAGLGPDLASTVVDDYGEEEVLAGALLNERRVGVPDAFICIYSSVSTDEAIELVGVVVTGLDGRYEFPLPAGPSRNLTAVYRSDQGQLAAWALLQVRASPTLRLTKSTVQNKHFAYFSGTIPGPHNDGVIVVLQVRSGKGWRVFRRYSTRNGGRYTLKYRFTRTFQPTTYLIRAQVSGAPGYPFLPGSSDPEALTVLP